MNVAIVHIRLMLKGGLETRLFNYTNYFLDRGDDVTLIVSKISPDVSLPPRVKIIQINLSNVPKPLRHLRFNNRLPQVLAHHRFDLVLSLERTSAQDLLIAPNTHKGYVKALGKRLLGPSDYIQIHLDRISYAATKKVFACSEMVRQEIIAAYKVPPEKVLRLYPPLDRSKFRRIVQVKDVLKRKFGLSPDKTTFLLVSASHKRKGLELLRKVFSRLPADRYELAVAGSEFTSDRENIHSLGFVEEMQELYPAADVTVHPAVYEPFGQIVSESIACGTPVLVSDRVGAKEILKSPAGMVVGSLRPDEWHRCLTQVADALDSFRIPEDYLDAYELDLDAHMKVILAVYEQLNSRGA